MLDTSQTTSTPADPQKPSVHDDASIVKTLSPMGQTAPPSEIIPLRRDIQRKIHMRTFWFCLGSIVTIIGAALIGDLMEKK